MKKLIKKNEKVVIVVCAATIAFLIFFTIVMSALKSTMEGNITTKVGSTTPKALVAKESLEVPTFAPLRAKKLQQTEQTTKRSFYSSTSPVQTESNVPVATSAITSTLPTTQKATERPDDFTSNAVNSKTVATNTSAPVSSLSTTFTAATKVGSTTPKALITTKSPDIPNLAAHQAVTARATSTTTVQPPLNWRFYFCAKDTVSKDYIKKCSEFPREKGQLRCLALRLSGECDKFNGFQYK